MGRRFLQRPGVEELRIGREVFLVAGYNGNTMALTVAMSSQL